MHLLSPLVVHLDWTSKSSCSCISRVEIFFSTYFNSSLVAALALSPLSWLFVFFFSYLWFLSFLLCLFDFFFLSSSSLPSFKNSFTNYISENLTDFFFSSINYFYLLSSSSFKTSSSSSPESDCSYFASYYSSLFPSADCFFLMILLTSVLFKWFGDLSSTTI